MPGRTAARRRVARPILFLMILALAGACARAYQPMGPVIGDPAITPDAVIAADGRRLPLRSWLPDGAPPRAVILALHGFNDYSYAFDDPGRYWAGRDIATYAYDQRGFGAGPQPGIWAGTPTLIQDAGTAARLIQERHPGVPFYLLGESMGGAEVLVLLGSAHAPDGVAGTILVAPALWGRETMPFYQRWALWLAVNLFPALELTGEGLGIVPSDNVEMLRGLGADPLVLKGNRVDTLNGLVDLMTLGRAAAPHIGGPVLYLYGEKEEVLPLDTVDTLLRELPPDPERTVAFYENGYHMLLRDLQREVVWRDIEAWITDPAAPLPSGADERGRRRIGEMAVAGPSR